MTGIFVFFGKFCESLGGLISNGGMPGEDHGPFCGTDQLRRFENRFIACDATVFTVMLQRNLGNLVRDFLGCDIAGKVNVASARFFGFRVLESDANDFVYRIRSYDLFRSFGDRRKHVHEIQVLMACQMHALRADLARNRH